MEPLRKQPDYREPGHRPQDHTDEELLELARDVVGMAMAVIASNPYLNTPPTKLKRMLGKGEGSEKERKQMQEALSAWRVTVPGPFRKNASSKRKLVEWAARRVSILMMRRDVGIDKIDVDTIVEEMAADRYPEALEYSDRGWKSLVSQVKAKALRM